MKTTHYLQLTAIGQGQMHVINRLANLLHGIKSANTLTFALAFPQMKTGNRPHTGNVIQVFSDESTLGVIFKELKDKPFIIDYVHLGRIKTVPDSIESYTEYALFRVPNRKTRTIDTRLRRITAAESLPYLRVTSKSNGQAFSVRIKSTRHEKPSNLIKPNSYGLAVTSRPFALPDIPVN